MRLGFWLGNSFRFGILNLRIDRLVSGSRLPVLYPTFDLVLGLFPREFPPGRRVKSFFPAHEGSIAALPSFIRPVLGRDRCRIF